MLSMWGYKGNHHSIQRHLHDVFDAFNIHNKMICPCPDIIDSMYKSFERSLIELIRIPIRMWRLILCSLLIQTPTSILSSGSTRIAIFKSVAYYDCGLGKVTINRDGARHVKGGGRWFGMVGEGTY